MREVARAAGVSQAAVSYAYNRPGKLSEQQRSRIFRIAAEMGYVGPNPAGRILRTGEIGALGLMVTDSLAYAFDDPATALLLKGISEVGELAEVALTLLPFPLTSDPAARGAGVLLRGLVDGFLIYAMPEGHPAVEIALSRQLPVVVIDAPVIEGQPWVGIKDRQAAEEIASHVLALGHREVGVLVNRLVPDGYAGVVSTSRMRSARDQVMKARLAGYAAAFRRAGVAWKTATIIEAGGFNYQRSRAAAEALLSTRPVTAIIAATDVLALAAIDVTTERGLHVPEDLSVVGFDDLPAAAGARLTTMRQPLVDKGREAARLLLDVLGGAPLRNVTLPTRLIVRESTRQRT